MHPLWVGRSVVLRLEPLDRQGNYEFIRRLPEWPEGELMDRLRIATCRSERIVRECELGSAGYDHRPG